MNELKLNRVYLLGHFLPNVDRLVQSDYFGRFCLEDAVARALLPICQMTVSYYTSELPETQELGAKETDIYFKDLSSYLISFITNVFNKELDTEKVGDILTRLLKEDRMFLNKNEKLLLSYEVNWTKSRELDNFKNQTFSEN